MEYEQLPVMQIDINSINESTATIMMQQIALDMGIFRPNYKFESTHLGKVATLVGLKETERGRATIQIVNYISSGSIFTTYISSLSSDFQTPEMRAFGSSVKNSK
ncbi:hypothetical protein NX722_08840 [Endozoicomonas gorgoniicola]|uniref:Uncharacterized protein n=1 Tax=Endozoicomonas gorgoniicola TaxID=1234144 RepID=A0ABT3MTQ2_9GAMM|nr:hypothetical protein [Endozoicomonas gorgoniicola]MCW7552745.1 hypothetical protein [Endozoicomonas gorgoniicola]